MGQVYSRQGKHEEAITQFKEAVSRNADLFEGYAQMGYSYADMGDIESAQKMVDTFGKGRATRAGRHTQPLHVQG